MFSSGRETEWRNRLIWGNKKYVLPSLLAEFAGQVKLIYIDPPFDTGANFSFTASIPDYSHAPEDEATTFTKEPSILEQKAYRDTWGVGKEDRERGVTHVDRYLKWFYDTAALLRELLADDGSIYVHIGQNISHYVKLVLDEVFGPGRYLNEIIWKRQSAKSGAFQGLGQYGRIHEVIFLYTKSESWRWNQQFAPYDEEYIEAFYKYVEPGTGKRFRLSDLTAAGSRKGESGGTVTVNAEPVRPAPGRHWALGLKRGESVQQAMDRLVKEGRIWHEPGKMPAFRRYREEMPGVMLQDVWTDIRPVPPQSSERRNYDTQKPEPLLERIIRSSSNEGDLIPSAGARFRRSSGWNQAFLHDP